MKWFLLFLVLVSPVSVSAQQLPACGTGQANGLLDGDIDHYDLICFDTIPDSYITTARNMNLLWIDRSVGDNIRNALNCLGSGAPYESASNACKTDTAEEYVSHTRYSIPNWTFAHYGDGGWWDSVSNFIQNSGLRTPINGALTPFTPNYDEVDVFNFQFSYLSVMQGSNIVGSTGYFVPAPGSTAIRDVNDMNAFENSRPNQTFVHATTSLARSIGGQTSYDFNNLMRQHAINSGEFIIDFADIGSHTPQGTQCFDNQTGQYPALCQNYTTEVNGGHLSEAIGGQRVAKAMWLMMTGVAGWRPGGSTTPMPTPTPQPVTLRQLVQNWLTATFDRNGDNKVNSLDFAIIIQ